MIGRFIIASPTSFSFEAKLILIALFSREALGARMHGLNTQRRRCQREHRIGISEAVEHLLA